MGNGRIDISYQVSHCPKSLSFAENLQAKTKKSMFMEVKTDLSLSELKEFLLTNYPDKKLAERKNKIYVGGKIPSIIPLIMIYDNDKYRIATKWGKGRDIIKFFFISLLLLLFILPVIVYGIWIFMNRNDIKNIFMAIKEEDTRVKELES